MPRIDSLAVTCPVLLLLPMMAQRPAAAVELGAEANGGRDYLFVSGDVRESWWDDRLTLGAGYTLVVTRAGLTHGMTALAALDFGAIAPRVAVGWAPTQGPRGWVTVAPGLGSRWSLTDRVGFEASATVLGRRAQAGRPHRSTTVDQLQAGLEVEVAVDERWWFGVDGLVSAYSRDLAASALRGGDTSAFITVGGRPERWAGAARAAWRFVPRWRLTTELGAVGYADGSGHALTPRAAIRSGPWAWITVEAGAELIVGLAGRVAGTRSLAGSLSLEVCP